MVASIGPLHAETVVAAPDEVASELCARFDGVRAGWVPLDVVAPTCDALVHHAGGVTTLTGMSAGVPQLLLPRGDALADAARRLERYGAAIVLPPSENKGANILKACEKLIDEPIHRERAQAIAHEIAAMPSPADVVGVIESLAAGSRS